MKIIKFFEKFYTDHIKVFMKGYINGWKNGKPQVRVGMIADILQILTFGVIISTLIGVLEFAYITKFGRLFFAGIVIIIFTLVWINIWQPIYRKVKDKNVWTNVVSIIHMALWMFLVPFISVGIYNNLEEIIAFLKSL